MKIDELESLSESFFASLASSVIAAFLALVFAGVAFLSLEDGHLWWWSLAFAVLSAFAGWIARKAWGALHER